MISFTTTLERFNQQGEKTGWTYVNIPAAIAEELKPGFKKSFRVKGKLDAHTIRQVALIPMGEGDFILPLNATLRKAIGKRQGDIVKVSITEDASEFLMNADLMACLADDEKANRNFQKLSGSEQRYFSKWIDSAKTDSTKAKRILQTIEAMHLGYHYGQMIRSLKKT